MATKKAKYGKTSMYGFLGDSFRLELGFFFELYEFWTEHRLEDISELKSSWERLSKKWGESEELIINFVDERDRLDSIRRELGYAMAILLCSLAEESLLRTSRQLKRDDPKLAEEFEKGTDRRGQSFLERYVHFHGDKFGIDFLNGVSPHKATRKLTGFLPKGLDVNVSTVDINLLFDFVWARNRIVHDRGTVRNTQILRKDGTRRDVPLEGKLGLDDEDRRARRSSILVRREYLERVTIHLLAFFDKVFEDLRARYE